MLKWLAAPFPCHQSNLHVQSAAVYSAVPFVHIYIVFFAVTCLEILWQRFKYSPAAMFSGLLSFSSLMLMIIFFAWSGGWVHGAVVAAVGAGALSRKAGAELSWAALRSVQVRTQQPPRERAAVTQLTAAPGPGQWPISGPPLYPRGSGSAGQSQGGQLEARQPISIGGCDEVAPRLRDRVCLHASYTEKLENISMQVDSFHFCSNYTQPAETSRPKMWKTWIFILLMLNKVCKVNFAVMYCVCVCEGTPEITTFISGARKITISYLSRSSKYFQAL